MAPPPALLPPAPTDGPAVTLLDNAERRRIVDMVFDDAEHADNARKPQFPLGLGRMALNIGAIAIRYLKHRDIAFMGVEALKTALARSDFPVHAAILSGLADSSALYKIKVEHDSCECGHGLHEQQAVETFLRIVAPLKSRLRIAQEMQVPLHNAFFVRGTSQFGLAPECLGKNEYMILPLDPAMLGAEVDEACDLLGGMCWPHVRAYIESMQDHQSVGTF